MNRSSSLTVAPAIVLTSILVLALLGGLRLSSRASRPTDIAPAVWQATANGGRADALIILSEQADLGAARLVPGRDERLSTVYDALRETALRSQAPVRAELDAAGADYRAFYVTNAIAVKGDRELLSRIAARPEVERIDANPKIHHELPQPSFNAEGAQVAADVEWNVLQVRADQVWEMGYLGQGVVVGGQDTGYDWDHPAIVGQYRGFNGVTATHDYNWHDAIHTVDSDCGADSPVPCDDRQHGTHTMGTIVGGDGGDHRIGVAPDAQWIGCRNMEEGWGTPATYIECFEFFLAPYPIGGDPFTDGKPSLAPHVINNSWTCPPYEGCTPGTLETVVNNVREAGIMVVASAGNSGPECGSVQVPPAIYDSAFSVGATDSGDAIVGFSSRGPVTVDGSGRRKPDVAAPGLSVRSCLPGGGYGRMSGTSMAGPHVAGAAALLWSAAPQLRGNVARTEWFLERSARSRTASESCGNDDPGDSPNNVYGWGIVDALAAVHRAELGLSLGVEPDPVAAGGSITYTVQAMNIGTQTLTAAITMVLPTPISAAGTLTWTAPLLSPGATWTRTVAADVSAGFEGRLTAVLAASYGAGSSATYTSTSQAVIPSLDVAKSARIEGPSPGTRLPYTLFVTNTGSVPLNQLVLSDSVPVGTEFFGASGVHAWDGAVVTWTAPSLVPSGVLTRLLHVTPIDPRGGTRIVNADYGAQARGMLAPVPGASTIVTLPWRVWISSVSRGWEERVE